MCRFPLAGSRGAMPWFSPTKRQDHRDPTKGANYQEGFHYLECKSEETRMRIGIATDHGGFSLKEELLGALRAAGHEVVDFGAHRLSESDDYPDYVVPLALAVAAGEVGSRSSDLRQRRRRVGVCKQGAGHPCGADPRPLLCQARSRRRSHEHPVY